MSPASQSPVLQKIVNFNFSDVSLLRIYTTQGNSRIIQLMVGIDVGFDGEGWSLSVGDDFNNQSLYALPTLNLVQTFQAFCGKFYADITNINLYLNSGSATVGSGFVYILEA